MPAAERLGPAQRLAVALRRRRTLLVLDNCEHVVDEAADLVELLLRSCPELHVLTTGQEALALAGETLWAVPTLPPDDAVALFTARARAATPGLVLDARDMAAVRAVCRRLDGIPLALELAATRVRALGVHRLLDRLDDRFRLLDTGLRGVPARQQTLRAVIDWSWDLLDDTERGVLRRLAVHADGCTAEAAREVCAGSGPTEVSGDDVLDVLARLVDRSLVTAEPGPRYRLLESVAAYCTDRMREAGELEAVRDRHLAHYTAVAEQAAPRLRGHGQQDWLRRLDTEAANLRAALDTAVDGGRATAALRLADALAWYWVLRGRLAEARRSLAAALAVPGEADPRPRARVEVWHAGVTLLTGDGDGRAEAVRRSLADGADPAGPWFLGHVLCATGAVTEAEEATAAALAGFRARDDRWGEAAALADRAVQRLIRGDLAGAESDGARSAELFTAFGDDAARLWTVYPLSELAEIHGDYDRAARLRTEGLHTARRLGLATLAADLLAGLGRGALLTGDPAAARAHHEDARRTALEHGFRAGAVNAELGLGLGARREGALDEAERWLRGVLDWHRHVGLHGANALVLAELGFVAELRGDAATALSLQEEGYAMAATTRDPRALALALEGLAGAHTLAGRPAHGALLLGAAATARASTGAPLPPAERADVDRITRAARGALGEPEFAAAYERGRALSPQEAHRAT
jgi:predicted ATPase